MLPALGLTFAEVKRWNWGEHSRHFPQDLHLQAVRPGLFQISKLAMLKLSRGR